ncbi:MAG: ArsA-related P-loop ATPase [Acidimicrobiales bacterium]
MSVASASAPDLDRRLLIVAGKGGVGRSSFAAALARHRADAAAAGEIIRAGRGVLAVDSIADGGLAAALGPSVPGVECLELDTEAALDEYLKIYMKFPIPPSRLGPLAKIFDYVATAAPGVREILTIGKIAWEVREGDWRAVVVDAPATGHVVELLNAPANLARLIGVGPLAEQTRWVEAILADPAQTGVVLVTTTEELPVTELLELHQRLVSTTAVDVVGIVANRMPPLLGPKAMAEAGELRGALGLAGRVVAERSEEARTGLARLGALGLPIIRVAESDRPVDDMVAAIAEAAGRGSAAVAGRSGAPDAGEAPTTATTRSAP